MKLNTPNKRNLITKKNILLCDKEKFDGNSISSQVHVSQFETDFELSEENLLTQETLNSSPGITKINNIEKNSKTKSCNFSSMKIKNEIEEIPSSQEKSTQSNDANFSTIILDDFLLERGENLNLSQISATTEDYDLVEYENVVLQPNLSNNNGISISISSNNLQPNNKDNTRGRSHVSRNIFGVQQSKKLYNNIEIQTDESFLAKKTNSQQNFNSITKCNEAIVNTLVNDVIKVIANEVSKNISELTTNIIKKTTPVKKTSEKNDGFIKFDVQKTKTDSRYSEENHIMLCTNVQKIGDWVLKHFDQQLSTNSVKLFKSLINLNNLSYQAFCLRLFTRQNKWHNFVDICSTLKLNMEKDEQEEMLKILVDKHLLVTDYTKEPVSILLNFLNRTQVKEICSETKIRKTPSKKEGMITALIQNAGKQMTLSPLKTSDDILRERIKVKLGTCVKLSSEARDILNKIHMLYALANPDLETPNDIYKLLNDIHFEHIKYPQFQVDEPYIFSSSQDLDRYIEAIILRKELDEEMLNKEAKNNWCFLCEQAFERFKNLFINEPQKNIDLEKPLFLRRYSATWIYCSVVSTGALNLGKHYPQEVCKWLKFLLKQKVYCPNKRGIWYAQLALVSQSHLKDIPTAAEWIKRGLNDELVDEVTKYELSVRGSKIRKGKITEEFYITLQNILLPTSDKFPSRIFQANIVHDNVPGRKKSYIRTTTEGREYGSVEETAISFYLEEKVYTSGIHCEGSLLSMLYNLLFWDIIYNVHVPNTFISNIQRYPLDMYSGEFFDNRKEIIDQRLKEIGEIWTEDEICEFISKVMHNHASELKLLIQYDFNDEEYLNTIVRCIGVQVLSAVCRRFANDFRLFRAGLPDLFLWNPTEKKCCFVEVKGEKDKLSTKQILWLNYLQSAGAKIELCLIQDIGSKSSKTVCQENEESD